MSTILIKLQRYKWYLSIIVIIGVGVYLQTHKTPVSPFETVKVEKGNIVQEVSVTGKIEPDTEVDLAFEKSGRVVSVPVAVGDKVKAGKVLVRLDASEISALRTQAQANLDYELAKLGELKRGSRPEDVAISKSQVDSATQALEDARRGLVDKLENSYTQSDDAIRNKVDTLLRNARTANPELDVPVTDARLTTQIPPARVSLESTLTQWEELNKSLEKSPDIATDAATVEAWIDQTKDYLDMLAHAVNSIVASSQTSQATIDAWKANVSLARNNVNTAISNIVSAHEKYSSARTALQVAQQQLALKVAGATTEELAAQEAKIASMRATVSNYDAQITKNSIIAPFTGIVTKQDAKLGQSVTAGMSLVSLMSDGQYQVTANVPEVDVAKVSIGDKSTITLDAYGSEEKFLATVARINPAETILEGVPTYKVTLLLDQPDPRIKSGMTANITIKTAEREQVLAVPGRAVLSREGEVVEKFVRVPDGTLTREVPVKTGLRGSNGMVEILDGLKEGDLVITFENSAK